MTTWEFEDCSINTIGDMGEDGFAWIKAAVSLRTEPEGPTCWVEVRLPMAYRSDETVEAVRRRAYEEIIGVMRVSASRLAERPPPPLDKSPA